MKKTIICAFIFLLILNMLLGCTPTPAISIKSETKSVQVSSEVSPAVQSTQSNILSVATQKSSSVSKTQSVAAKPEKSQKQLFSEAVMNFGLTMLAQMPRDGKSTVLSPVSLAIPLSLLANGTRGQSYDELAAVLGIKDITAWNEQFTAYQKFLNENSEFISSEEEGEERSYLKFGNSIWARDSVIFNTDFLNINENYFSAKLATYDNNYPSVAAEQINNWVRQMTEGKIENIVKENDIRNASTTLINAIYFDFCWDDKYLRYIDGDFKSYDGNVISTDFMVSGDLYRYIKGENVKGFKQNYYGNQYYFAALLPDEGIDIYDFAASLTGEKLQEIIKSEKEKEDLITWLPKFKIDNDLDCSEFLKAAGVKQIFNDNADLSGYALDWHTPLYVDKVIQKAGIDVDKNGTVAYAATDATTPVMGGSPPTVIKLDRPFLYVIADEKYNIPLFIGIVASVEPETGECENEVAYE